MSRCSRSGGSGPWRPCLREPIPTARRHPRILARRAKARVSRLWLLALALGCVTARAQETASPTPEAETFLDVTITAPREPKREVPPQKLRPEELRSIPGTAGDP